MLWTPVEISSQILQQIDPSDSSTITIDTGISVITDKNGGGLDYAQPIVSLQPALISSELNGLDVMRFDSDLMKSPRVLDDDDFSLFCIVKSGPQSNATFIAQHTGNTASGRIVMLSAEPTTPFNAVKIFFNSGASYEVVGDTAAFDSTWSLAYTESSGSGRWATRVDGGSEEGVFDSGQTVTPLNTDCRLGGYGESGDVTADIAYMMITKKLSGEDRQKVEGYLLWRFGLEANLPAEHPYKDAAPGLFDPSIIPNSKKLELTLDSSQITTDQIDFPLTIQLDSSNALHETIFTELSTTTGAVTAKSVIFDIANNQGDTQWINVRSIEFLSNGSVIPMTSGFSAYATTEYNTTSLSVSNIFDTSLSKIDAQDDAAWLTAINNTTNQRVIVVFDSELEFNEIVINNGHISGTKTNRGAKDTVITISSDTITSTVHGEAIANSIVLFDDTFPEHINDNVIDDQSVWLSDDIIKYKKLAIEAGNVQCPVEIENWDGEGKYDEYTELLIQSNTAEGSTVFIDSAINNHTITTYGDPQHSSSYPSLGQSSSIYFDGDDYFGATMAAFGTGDFTIDCWLTILSVSDTPIIMDTREGDFSVNGFTWYVASGRLKLGTGNPFIGTPAATTLTINTPHHVAFIRTGSQIKMYLNGVLDLTAANTSNFSNTVWKIGSNWSGAADQCYISEFRVSVGVVRWVEDFTPPTTPYISTKSATLHTKVPTYSSSTDTELTLSWDSSQVDNTSYIGDTTDSVAQAVWDANFKAVYHMAQDPSGGVNSILDSTINVKHGTPPGSMTTDNLIDGSVGKALSFDGSNDYIDIGESLNNPTELTWEVLSKSNVSDTSEQRVFTYNNNGIFVITSVNGGTANKIQTYVSASTGGGWSESTTDYSVTDYQHIVSRVNTSEYQTFVSGTPIGSPTAYSGMSDLGVDLCSRIGASRTPDSFCNGSIDEVRLSSMARSDDWIKLTNLSLTDQLITFTVPIDVNIYWYSPYPIGGVKEYGTSQDLSLIATVSGNAPPYYCDTSFYSSIGTPLGNTVSGILSGEVTTLTVPTTSGTDYFWYAQTTISGLDISDTTPTYSFYVRYLCSGICNSNSLPASGIGINLHRRLDGQLIGTTTTAGTGIFYIDSQFNEQHYVVALHPDSATNAKIYDKIIPE